MPSAFLRDLPGWEPIIATPQVAAETGRVNARCGEGQNRPVQGCQGARFLIEPGGRINESSLDASANAGDIQSA